MKTTTLPQSTQKVRRDALGGKRPDGHARLFNPRHRANPDTIHVEATGRPPTLPYALALADGLAAMHARWWGPDRGGTSHAEADARVGGGFRVVFRTEDGEEHDVSGVYREVVPDERLVFTWAWRSTPERESLVTVELRPDGEGTSLTLTHERFFDEPARDRHREGWSGSLDKLERLFA